MDSWSSLTPGGDQSRRTAVEKMSQEIAACLLQSLSVLFKSLVFICLNSSWSGSHISALLCPSSSTLLQSCRVCGWEQRTGRRFPLGMCKISQRTLETSGVGVSFRSVKRVAARLLISTFRECKFVCKKFNCDANEGSKLRTRTH